MYFVQCVLPVETAAEERPQHPGAVNRTMPPAGANFNGSHAATWLNRESGKRGRLCEAPAGSYWFRASQWLCEYAKSRNILEFRIFLFHEEIFIGPWKNIYTVAWVEATITNLIIFIRLNRKPDNIGVSGILLTCGASGYGFEICQIILSTEYRLERLNLCLKNTML